MQSVVFGMLGAGGVDVGAVPLEDCCFTLSSSDGRQLDLEGESIEATQGWLKQLSTIINTSGKDIVLAGSEDQTGAEQNQAGGTAQPDWTVRVDSDAPDQTKPTSVQLEDNTTKSTTSFDVASVSTAPASVVPSPSSVTSLPSFPSAHDLLVGGVGFPFTLHYIGLDNGLLTRTRVLMSFTSHEGGTFILKTIEPSLRPTNAHGCLTEPHTFQPTSYEFDHQSGDLCIWDGKILLGGLSDVYLGVTKGLFGSSSNLSTIDPSRCVTLVVDIPQPTLMWDLEANSTQEFVEWLTAFNAILQATDQEVAVESNKHPSSDLAANNDNVAPSPTTNAPVFVPSTTTPTPVAPKSEVDHVTPSQPTISRSMESMRRGGYFYLYTKDADAAAGVADGRDVVPSSTSVSKKLIFLFYNDSPTRPLHFAEEQLLVEQQQQQQVIPDSSLVRSSLFYRYVADVGSPSSPSPASSSLLPLHTDECISIFHVTDFLLGKQTPLMCHAPLTTFVGNNRCFSLVLQRYSFVHGRIETFELGFECIESLEQMSIWLEGIMEVSNRVNGMETDGMEGEGNMHTNVPVTPSLPTLPNNPNKPNVSSSSTTTTTTTTPTPTPSLLPNSRSNSCQPPVPTQSASLDPLLSIEHVVSSPRTCQLASNDPSILVLSRGTIFQSWEDYTQPTRRKIILFYVHHDRQQQQQAEKDNTTGVVTVDDDDKEVGRFYWNYLPDNVADFTRPSTSTDDDLTRVKNKLRSFTLASLQSVYHGRISSIFRRRRSSSSAAASAVPCGAPATPSSHLFSFLTDDDLLNLEGSSRQAVETFLNGIKYILLHTCAKNLIRVPEEANSPDEEEDDTPTDPDNDVRAWFNVQEAVFPVNLASSNSLVPPPVAGMPSLTPPSAEDALTAFARGQCFSSWTLQPSKLSSPSSPAPDVRVTRITLFFQQTLDDAALFFVWVNTGAEDDGGEGGVDSEELRKAKSWSRTIRTASELSSSHTTHFPYSYLLVSHISDLHIGKNLPIFTTTSKSVQLLPDECVSIVATEVEKELHLVATRGIAQIATTISAVTTLLEHDGTRVNQTLWNILRDGQQQQTDEGNVEPKRLEFGNAPTIVVPTPIAVPVGAGLAPAGAGTGAVSCLDDPLLATLKDGSTFWLWCYDDAATSDIGKVVTVSDSCRNVVRRSVCVRWLPSIGGDLGQLTWTIDGVNSTLPTLTSLPHTSMSVSHISDIYVGAEATVFLPTNLIRTLQPDDGTLSTPTIRNGVADDKCFSILSLNGELHLENSDSCIINQWVDGLSRLLQYGGRSLTEEPAIGSNNNLDMTPTIATNTTLDTTQIRNNTTIDVNSVNHAEPIAVAPTVPATVVDVTPLPVMPTVPAMSDILALTRALTRAIDENKLNLYNENEIERALAAIRDAAATQTRHTHTRHKRSSVGKRHA